MRSTKKCGPIRRREESWTSLAFLYIGRLLRLRSESGAIFPEHMNEYIDKGGAGC